MLDGFSCFSVFGYSECLVIATHHRQENVLCAGHESEQLHYF